MLFRHDSLLVNVQQHARLLRVGESSHHRDHTAASLSFDLSDKMCWIQLLPSSSLYAIRAAAAGPDAAVRTFTGHPAADMMLGTLGTGSATGNNSSSRGVDDDAAEVVEQRVEDAVRNMIASMRADRGLATQFDDQLSIILQPALVAYEMERTVGMGSAMTGGASSQLQNDFQNSIRFYVGGKGESFKAFPTCFSHVDVDAIKMAVSSATAAREIYSVPVAGFAVRAKVFPFPSGIVALWLMIGVRHPPLHIHINN
jgi:hypothetical protein